MANFIVESFLYFRQQIKATFDYSKEAQMSLVDAIAASKSGNSVVKMSLSNLFPRHHTSIYHAIDDLFRSPGRKAEDTEKQMQLKHGQLTEIFAKECPKPIEDRFFLLGTDCTSHPRVFAKKLEDRTMVHAPNKVAGAPVTIGHQYSIVACLPAKAAGVASTWVHPLSVERVKSSEIGTTVGLKQLSNIVQGDHFKGHLCVHVADAAYSAASYIKGAEQLEDVVQILRLRGNRVLNKTLPERQEVAKKGRPTRYGEELRLKDPTPANEMVVIHGKCRHERSLEWKIERWKNVLVRGEEQCAAIDVVRVQVSNEEGLVYAKPLWLAIVGKRRKELSLEQIYEAYAQRYDLEHFFRFSKHNLLMDRFQTPEVKHEEKWWWMGLIAYTMLHKARGLSECIVYPWEKSPGRRDEGEKTPSQVQRSYERIIKETGIEVSIPKRRGKSPGRLKGQVVKRRQRQKVIKKLKKLKKQLKEVF
jgi:hypothetical protein